MISRKLGVLTLLGVGLCVSAAPAAEKVAEKEPSAKPVAVKKLGKDDASAFVRLTLQRTGRFDELAIFQRVLREKRAELQEALAKLEGDHGLDPKKSYSYETKTRKLLEVVPGKKAGDEPTKKEVTTYKSDEAAAPLARDMVARALVENQIAVLSQLIREKAQEAELVDGKIRKMYKLADDGVYSFNAEDMTIYRTGTKAATAAKADEPAKAKK